MPRFGIARSGDDLARAGRSSSPERYSGCPRGFGNPAGRRRIARTLPGVGAAADIGNPAGSVGDDIAAMRPIRSRFDPGHFFQQCACGRHERRKRRAARAKSRSPRHFTFPFGGHIEWQLISKEARQDVLLRREKISRRQRADFLELLPPNVIVERISGDAPPDYFIGPAWCLDKPAVKMALAAEFERRQSWQGRVFAAL